MNNYDESFISAKELDILNEVLSMKTLQPRSNIDPRKIQYNEYYKSFQFWEKKWPKGHSNVSHINMIIKDIMEKNNKTPLEEIKEKSEIIISER